MAEGGVVGQYLEDERHRIALFLTVIISLRVPPTTTHNQQLVDGLWGGPESIELFIKSQAFSRSYDLAPRPPPLSLPLSRLHR